MQKKKLSSTSTPIIALIISFISVIFIWYLLANWVGCLNADVTCWGSSPDGADETRSSIVRNLGLAVLGVMGAVLGIWRTLISHIEASALAESADAAHKQLDISARQTEIAVRQSELATKASEAAIQQNDTTRIAERERRIDKANLQLASADMDTRKAGVVALRDLFTDDHDVYIYVQTIFAKFIRESSQNFYDEDEILACPDDIREAVLSISILRNGDAFEEVEKAANWVPNLESSWFVGMGPQTRPLNLANAEIRNSNFSGANLRRVNFSRAYLTNCNFESARIYRANFEEVVARHANFKGVNLLVTNMQNSDCLYSDFSNSQLGGVNFNNTNLSHCNFVGASFDHVYHEKTNFEGAKLEAAKFLENDKQMLIDAGVDVSSIVFVTEQTDNI